MSDLPTRLRDPDAGQCGAVMREAAYEIERLEGENGILRKQCEMQVETIKRLAAMRGRGE